MLTWRRKQVEPRKQKTINIPLPFNLGVAGVRLGFWFRNVFISGVTPPGGFSLMAPQITTAAALPWLFKF